MYGSEGSDCRARAGITGQRAEGAEEGLAARVVVEVRVVVRIVVVGRGVEREVVRICSRRWMEVVVIVSVEVGPEQRGWLGGGRAMWKPR